MNPLINTDFTHEMVLEIVQHMDVFSGASFIIIIIIFLLQKMDNKVINKKAEIADIVQIFKQNLELKSDEMTEKRSNILKSRLKGMKK